MWAFESCLWSERWALVWWNRVFLEIHGFLQIDLPRLHRLSSDSRPAIFCTWRILRLSNVNRIEPDAERFINFCPVRIWLRRHRPGMFELTCLNSTFKSHFCVENCLLFLHDGCIFLVWICPNILLFLCSFSLWLDFLEKSTLRRIHSLFHLLLHYVLLILCLEDQLWLRALWWFHLDLDWMLIWFARNIWLCVVQLFRGLMWLPVVYDDHFTWCGRGLAYGLLRHVSRTPSWRVAERWTVSLYKDQWLSLKVEVCCSDKVVLQFDCRGSIFFDCNRSICLWICWLRTDTLLWIHRHPVFFWLSSYSKGALWMQNV